MSLVTASHSLFDEPELELVHESHKQQTQLQLGEFPASQRRLLAAHQHLAEAAAATEAEAAAAAAGYQQDEQDGQAALIPETDTCALDADIVNTIEADGCNNCAALQSALDQSQTTLAERESELQLAAEIGHQLVITNNALQETIEELQARYAAALAHGEHVYDRNQGNDSVHIAEAPVCTTESRHAMNPSGHSSHRLARDPASQDDTTNSHRDQRHTIEQRRPSQSEIEALTDAEADAAAAYISHLEQSNALLEKQLARVTQKLVSADAKHKSQTAVLEHSLMITNESLATARDELATLRKDQRQHRIDEKNRLDSLSSSSMSGATSAASLEEAYDALMVENERLRQETKESTAALSEHRDKIKSLSNKITALTDELERLGDIEQQSAILQASIDEAHSHRMQMLEEVEALREEVSHLRAGHGDEVDRNHGTLRDILVRVDGDRACVQTREVETQTAIAAEPIMSPEASTATSNVTLIDAATQTVDSQPHFVSNSAAASPSMPALRLGTQRQVHSGVQRGSQYLETLINSPRQVASMRSTDAGRVMLNAISNPASRSRRGSHDHSASRLRSGSASSHISSTSSSGADQQFFTPDRSESPVLPEADTVVGESVSQDSPAATIAVTAPSRNSTTSTTNAGLLYRRLNPRPSRRNHHSLTYPISIRTDLAVTPDVSHTTNHSGSLPVALFEGASPSLSSSIVQSIAAFGAQMARSALSPTATRLPPQTTLLPTTRDAVFGTSIDIEAPPVQPQVIPPEVLYETHVTGSRAPLPRGSRTRQETQYAETSKPYTPSSIMAPLFKGLIDIVERIMPQITSIDTSQVADSTRSLV